MVRRSTMSKLSSIFCLLILLLLAATWFALANADHWPSGSSPPGMAFGIAGGAIILFEAAYGVRRRLTSWQLGTRPVWLRAHLKLGLLSLPLIAMHAGFRSGGVFTTSLIVVYVLVVASGIGLSWQLRRGDALAEVSPSRIDALRHDHARQVRELIEQVCGVTASDEPDVATDGHGARDHIVLATDRIAGHLRGRVAEVHVQRAPLSGGEPLLSFWCEVVQPFFGAAPPKSSPLRIENSARREFAGLRGRLGAAFSETIDRVEACCDRRRELLELERQRAWIELWSLVHQPLTVALVVMAIAHAAVAWRFR